MAAPTTVITIVKDMTYRHVAGEEWSNTYALTGATPADSTAWRALFDAIVLLEKPCFTSLARVVKGYGYAKIPVKGDHAVWTLDLRPSSTTVPGSLAGGGGLFQAGDQAGWVRWSLDRFNTKGKRVYLRKYFHNGLGTTGDPDLAAATYVTALGNLGTKMMDGTLMTSRRICDKDGMTPIASTPCTYITTRTLKRRGKRPPRAAS